MKLISFMSLICFFVLMFLIVKCPDYIETEEGDKVLLFVFVIFVVCSGISLIDINMHGDDSDEHSPLRKVISMVLIVIALGWGMSVIYSGTVSPSPGDDVVYDSTPQKENYIFNVFAAIFQGAMSGDIVYILVILFVVFMAFKLYDAV